MHLKKHSEIPGRWRRLEFYATARLDGLVCREDTFGVKITETFEDRVDRLTYRSVTFRIPDSGEAPHTRRQPRMCQLVV